MRSCSFSSRARELSRSLAFALAFLHSRSLALSLSRLLFSRSLVSARSRALYPARSITLSYIDFKEGIVAIDMDRIGDGSVGIVLWSYNRVSICVCAHVCTRASERASMWCVCVCNLHKYTLNVYTPICKDSQANYMHSQAYYIH